MLCTTLGGRKHGHPGLALSPAEYKCIVSKNSYVCAAQLAVFVVDSTAIQFQQSQRERDVIMKLFETTNQLDHTLLQQIQEVINPNYFKSEIDVNTRLFNRTCMAVLKLLFNHYNHVTSK